MDNDKSANNANPNGPLGRRRSSGPTFHGLMNLKRGDSDPSTMARRQSLQDQKPQAGYFGQLWNSFTRGPHSPTK
ncbi:hypothetical protein DL770_004248 [Monosporascus sp. CRB-9-2]|nr:hypothetical protein DL770_004248 [Monosporascus sp. CRB-9-2]